MVISLHGLVYLPLSQQVGSALQVTICNPVRVTAWSLRQPPAGNRALIDTVIVGHHHTSS